MVCEPLFPGGMIAIILNNKKLEAEGMEKVLSASYVVRTIPCSLHILSYLILETIPYDTIFAFKNIDLFIFYLATSDLSCSTQALPVGSSHGIFSSQQTDSISCSWAQ